MKIEPFKLERYFAEHEFSAPFLLSASDCESLTLQELLAGSDPAGLELWRQLSLGYTESQGHPLLRQEVAQLYSAVAPDDLLILAPEEGIFITMHTLLRAGDHVIVTFPGYQSLYEIARSLGCRVTRWTLQPSEEGWALDLDGLAASITPQTRLLVVNFPHNPTGFHPESAWLEAVVELARRHDLYLLSDEMYRLLEYDPQQRLPAVCDRYEKGISLSGLSKSFALPGLRIGWIATRDQAVLHDMQAFRDYTTICSSAPSEVLAIMALRAKERIVSRNLDIIHHNRKMLDRFFGAYPDWFQWLRPQAGSIAFPQLTADLPVEVFCRQMLENKGVMIVPGPLFDYPGHHFRVGLGRRNLPDVVERVGEYLDTVTLTDEETNP